MLLRFLKRVERHQRRRGHFLGENPVGSRAYKQEELREMLEHTQQVNVDMCAYGLKHPTSGVPIKKSTRLQISPEVDVEDLRRRCPGHEQHHVVQGSFKNKDGTRMSLSEYCGGYTEEFARAVVKAYGRALSRKHIETQKSSQSCPRLSDNKFRELPENVLKEKYQDLSSNVSGEKRRDLLQTVLRKTHPICQSSCLEKSTSLRKSSTPPVTTRRTCWATTWRRTKKTR